MKIISDFENRIIKICGFKHGFMRKNPNSIPDYCTWIDINGNNALDFSRVPELDKMFVGRIYTSAQLMLARRVVGDDICGD